METKARELDTDARNRHSRLAQSRRSSKSGSRRKASESYHEAVSVESSVQSLSRAAPEGASAPTLALTRRLLAGVQRQVELPLSAAGFQAVVGRVWGCQPAELAQSL